jgi:hypothetical protein
MLARDRLTLSQMSWILVKVFFGYGTPIFLPRGSKSANTECDEVRRLLGWYVTAQLIKLLLHFHGVAELIGWQDVAQEVSVAVLWFSPIF